MGRRYLAIGALLLAMALAPIVLGSAPLVTSADPGMEQPAPSPAVPSGITLCTAGTLVGNSYFNYQPGWNLVAGFQGRVLTGNVGPIYSFQSEDETYLAQPPDTPLEFGAGYWASFPTAVSGPTLVNGPRTVMLPLSAGRYVLIGNPISAPVTALGADVLYTYDSMNGYVAATGLKPGQGAWAYSESGGTLTLTNATPCA